MDPYQSQAVGGPMAGQQMTFNPNDGAQPAQSIPQNYGQPVSLS